MSRTNDVDHESGAPSDIDRLEEDPVAATDHDAREVGQAYPTKNRQELEVCAITSSTHEDLTAPPSVAYLVRASTDADSDHVVPGERRSTEVPISQSPVPGDGCPYWPALEIVEIH